MNFDENHLWQEEVLNLMKRGGSPGTITVVDIARRAGKTTAAALCAFVLSQNNFRVAIISSGENGTLGLVDDEKIDLFIVDDYERKFEALRDIVIPKVKSGTSQALLFGSKSFPQTHPIAGIFNDFPSLPIEFEAAPPLTASEVCIYTVG